MKRIWSILLTITVALTLLCPMTAYAATGEGNIDGGGGNLGDATSHGSWNPGNEGVRVTIVRSDDHAVVSTPIAGKLFRKSLNRMGPTLRRSCKTI